ncbi:MAG: sigma-70 family RNA polymerase sigma factor [Gammaproteobacteria bacterium]|nr:sigma-70 family RNA polymerase sigma factor [Gammaproteobacteria bacterium]
MITAKSESVNDSKVIMLVESSPDDWSDLLVRVGKDRDRDAFSRLFAHFAPLVKGFLMKGSNLGAEQAEELVQETMIKVWNKADSFNRQKSSASTWIYTIARNSRIDWFRREARSQVDINADDLYDTGEENPSYSSLVRVRDKENIRNHIGELPKEQLEVVTKVYYEGKSHSDVSDELGLPLGTVKSRIRLALKRMRLTLANDEAE